MDPCSTPYSLSLGKSFDLSETQFCDLLKKYYDMIPVIGCC